MKKIIIALSAVLLVSCGSNTTIQDSWRDPQTTIEKEQFKKVLVVSLLKNETNRRVAENTIVATNPELFHPSYDLLDQTNLKLPIEYHYEKIVFELNSQILEDYEGFLGLEKKHPLLRTKEEDEKIKELIRTDEKYSKLIMGFYEEKQIYKSLNNTITRMLNEIKK